MGGILTGPAADLSFSLTLGRHADRMPITTSGRGGWVFLREFTRAPLRTASVVPSSRALAVQMVPPMCQAAWVGRHPVVVELGPGTGAFTELIQQIAPRGTRHIGVELNPAMADHLASRFPEVEVITGPASDLPQILGRCGLEGADRIVSGVPWQGFAGPAGGRLISTIAGCLRPGGVYTQFTYSWTRWAPPARRQHRALLESFEEVRVLPTVWRNLPPAFVYISTRPRPSAADPITSIGAGSVR
jgi:phosphatidylethanolamine/phosphatidyl-N-methylethanolamine N-methyltransferase